jgi:hypothetical protein
VPDLSTVTTPTRTGPDLFQIDVPDGWQQGRGSFGGLVLANLVRAIEAGDDGPGERPLRALTATLCGPVEPGISTIRVERLRAGTGVSTVAARLERGGEVLATAVGVLGKRRTDDVDFCDLPRPTMPPWREVPVTVLPVPPAPVFSRFFEFRSLSAPPFSGATDPVVNGWVRPRDPGPARGAAYVTALADAWWPTLLVQARRPRPVATISFTLELFEGLDGLDPEAPLFHTARAAAGRGGYVVEMRELRGEDGRLVALNQQTFAVIK